MSEARAAWLRQEHERRVSMLGENRASEWEHIVAQAAGTRSADGLVPADKVLQLMLDTYRQGRADARLKALGRVAALRQWLLAPDREVNL